MEIKRVGSEIEVSAWHDGGPPTLPDGYRLLLADEKPQAGDLAFNVVAEQWEPISEIVLATVSLFSKPIKDMFRYPPIRKQ